MRIRERLVHRHTIYTAMASPTLLFTENETNTERLFGVPNATPFVKDGINNCVVHGQNGCGESPADRDEGRGALRLTVSCGRIADVAPAAQRPGA